VNNTQGYPPERYTPVGILPVVHLWVSSLWYTRGLFSLWYTRGLSSLWYTRGYSSQLYTRGYSSQLYTRGLFSLHTRGLFPPALLPMVGYSLLLLLRFIFPFHCWVLSSRSLLCTYCSVWAPTYGPAPMVLIMLIKLIPGHVRKCPKINIPVYENPRVCGRRNTSRINP